MNWAVVNEKKNEMIRTIVIAACKTKKKREQIMLLCN